jgi:hypothetical protein
MLHIYAWSQAYVFKCFQLLQTYVLSISSGCCIYFAMVRMCFSAISDIYCKCFSCFGRMLQVFHLDVAKVDLVLHMFQWDPPAVVDARGRRRDGTRCGGERRKRRGMAARARAVPICPCNRARSPPVTGETR